VVVCGLDYINATNTKVCVKNFGTLWVVDFDQVVLWMSVVLVEKCRNYNVPSSHRPPIPAGSPSMI